MRVNSQHSPDTGGRKQAFAFARAVVVALFVLMIALYLWSIPLQFEQMHLPCTRDVCPNFQLTAENMARMQQQGISLDAFAVYVIALNTGLILAFWVVAVLIFLSKSWDWMGLYVSTTLMLFGISFPNLLFWVGEDTPLVHVPIVALTIVASCLFVTLFFVFPDGRFVPRWTRWFVLFIILRETASVLYPDAPLVSYGLFGELAFILFAQIYRYRRVSTPVQRQQTKWFLYGVVVTVIGFASVSILTLLPNNNTTFGSIEWLILGAVLYLSISIIPLSIGMAILRSHLWDIDILIRRTLIYGALTVMLALVYFGLVVGLQQALRQLTGQGSDVAVVISTLAIAALFLPLRGRVQRAIDRRFYRRKYDAQKILAGFGATVRDEVELDSLAAHLLAVVQETMEPAQASLWLRATNDGGGKTDIGVVSWSLANGLSSTVVGPRSSIQEREERR